VSTVFSASPSPRRQRVRDGDSHRVWRRHGLAIGGSDPHRPIDASSIGRHAAVLTATQVDEVMAWTAPLRTALARHLDG
jgi:hypothetical protein